MKIILPLSAALLLFGCGSAEDTMTVEKTAGNELMTASEGAPAGSAPAPKAKDLPWGMPHMPNARYIHMVDNFSRPIGPHGGEATALIAYKGTPKDVVDFFDTVAKEMGFDTTIASYSDEKTANLSARDSGGKVFYVYAKRGGRKAEEAESSATLVFQLPK